MRNFAQRVTVGLPRQQDAPDHRDNMFVDPWLWLDPDWLCWGVIMARRLLLGNRLDKNETWQQVCWVASFAAYPFTRTLLKMNKFPFSPPSNILSTKAGTSAHKCPPFLFFPRSWPQHLVQSAVCGAVQRNREARDTTLQLAAETGITAAANLITGQRLVYRLAGTPAATNGPQNAAEVPPLPINGRECAILFPPLAPCAGEDLGGCGRLAPEDCQGDCQGFRRALRAFCERHLGCIWQTSSRVTGLVMSADGEAVEGVVMETGEDVLADVVVVCAGKESGPLLSTAGVYAPIVPLRGASLTIPYDGHRLIHAGVDPMRLRLLRRANPDPDEKHAGPNSAGVAPAPPMVTTLDNICYCVEETTHLYITPMDGSLRFSCYGVMHHRSRDVAGIDAALHARLRQLAANVCPTLSEAIGTYAVADGSGGDVSLWAGDRPMTPDGHALVGLTRKANLYINAGHSFNGWRQACITAKLVAGCVAADDNAALGPYRGLYGVERFKLLPPPL